MCNKIVKSIYILSVFVLTEFILISSQIYEAKWSKTYITSGLYPVIFGTSEPSSSVMRCSATCSRSPQFESFYYSSAQKECYCNIHLDGTMNPTTVNTGLIYGIRENHIESQDCLALYQRGFTTDGVYVIYPVSGVPVSAWCDMTGGGWTVFQRRQDGSENFYRTWNDYVNGFGNKLGEYWLGLENIRVITTQASTLRIELETFGDRTPVSAFAEYSSFAVGSSASKYQLALSGFSGDCGDSLSYHNGMPFTTYDFENDAHPTENCAVNCQGAWWYNACYFSNLNGLYLGGVTTTIADSVLWYHCWGDQYSLKTTVMKVRRNIL